MAAQGQRGRWRSWPRILAALVAITYAAGYGCVRIVGKNAAYTHDSSEDPDATYVPDTFVFTCAVYYLYWPVLEIDRRLTGRRHRLTDVGD